MLKSGKGFYTIGVGSSAGGLTSLIDFFKTIDPKSRHAFVVIPHLQRDFKSVLHEILSRHTKLPLIKVAKEMPIEPGKIFLLSENTTLTIANGVLTTAVRDKSPLNFAINIFFESLAVDFKHEAVGVVMSGVGNDGLKGAIAIEKAGGLIFVQEPSSAQEASMPLSTIIFDHPNLIGNPQLLAQFVNQLGRS